MMKQIMEYSALTLMLLTSTTLHATDNTLYGTGAGAGLTTGTNNVFVGNAAGENVSTGLYNTMLGSESGAYFGAGNYNVLLGALSGYNASGSENTFVGVSSGLQNTADYNTFVGAYSGNSTSTGTKNTFLGASSGRSNQDGTSNTFVGYYSGKNATSHDNTFVGSQSGESTSTGANNVFIGSFSGQANTTGSANTIIGVNAGYSATTSYNNTFIGQASGSATVASSNTFIGQASGNQNTTGTGNVFIGSNCAVHNKIGRYNAYLGSLSGYNADVNSSIFLGYKAGYDATRSNTLYIANSETQTPLIYGEFDNDLVRVNGNFEFTGTMNAPLVVNSTIDANDIISAKYDGASDINAMRMLQLGNNNANSAKMSDVAFWMENTREDFAWEFRTLERYAGFSISKFGSGGQEMYLTGLDSQNGMELILGNGAKNSGGQWLDASSRKYKENIAELDTESAMAAFTQLKPVTYNYKTNKTEPIVGFIAEEVPELVSVNGRDALSALEIAALLTKVVQTQEQTLKVKEAEIKNLEARVERLEAILSVMAFDKGSDVTPQKVLSAK